MSCVRRGEPAAKLSSGQAKNQAPQFTSKPPAPDANRRHVTHVLTRAGVDAGDPACSCSGPARRRAWNDRMVDGSGPVGEKGSSFPGNKVAVAVAGPRRSAAGRVNRRAGRYVYSASHVAD